MKNRFSIIIINEQTKKNITFNLSKFLVRLIIIFFTFSLFILIASTYNIYTNSSLKNKNKQLYKDQQQLINIISALNEGNLIPDSLNPNYKFLLNKYNNNIIENIVAPVEGIVTQGITINQDKPHYGLDIATTYKTPIKSIQDGIVIFANKLEVLGNTVIISHQNNYFSLYAHMHSYQVKARDWVSQNEIIGLVGKGKNEEGPHLHFEIWHNNLIIDPRNLIKEYKIKDVSIR
tara:strand:+ start:265 stop:963 length:699 start_codon:yes stop_codon:yes gene_type:complete